MKKLSVFMLVCVLLLGVTSCGGGGSTPTSAPTTAPTVAPTTAPTSAPPTYTDTDYYDLYDPELRYVGNKQSIIIGEAALQTMHAEWIPFVVQQLVSSSRSYYRPAVDEDDFYLLSNEGDLELYLLLPEGLIFEEDVPLPDGHYTHICNDEYGTIYISGPGRPFVAYDFYSLLFYIELEGIDLCNVSMHPYEDWGISWGTEPHYPAMAVVPDEDPEAVELFDFDFYEFYRLFTVSVSDNYIFAAGLLEDSRQAAIIAFDLDMEPEYTLGGVSSGNQRMGEILDVFEVAFGFMATDADRNRLMFWDYEGDYLGAVSAEELLSSATAVLDYATMLPDGSVIITARVQPPKGSAQEIVIYKLSFPKG